MKACNAGATFEAEDKILSLMPFIVINTIFLLFSRFFSFKIRTLLSSVSRQTGEPDLQKALEAAKEVFDKFSTRPNAKKVLVVIMDKKPTDTQDDIQEALKPLEGDKIKVVSVAVGPEADVETLKNITSTESNFVKAAKTVTPTKLAKDIMDKVISGMRL